jgi:anti-sigma regulatory factor (Ser/Thr protein kinase)
VSIDLVELRSWRLHQGDVSAAMQARRAFKRFVHGLAATTSDLAGAELIFGELASNGVEHGSGTTTLVLSRSGDELVLSVAPGDGWAPPGPSASKPSPEQTRGRGWFFVRSLARRVDSAPGSPTRIILPLQLR